MKLNDRFKNLGKKPSFPPLDKLRKDFNLKRNHNYLIIEGRNNSSDNVVYSNVKDINCIVQPSGNREDILEEFVVTYPNQVAIVDRDYDLIESNVNNLFYTDYNDVECTAIKFVNDFHEFYRNIPVENKAMKENVLSEIYQKTLVLSNKVSNINKFIIDYNNKHEKKHKYILNLCNDINSKKVFEIFDNNNELNYKRIIEIYREEYNEFNVLESELIKIADEESLSFRGHDFFIILACLFEKYKIKVLDLKDDYRHNPSLFLEKKFIEQYAKDKKVKMTRLYHDVINTKSGIFESFK